MRLRIVLAADHPMYRYGLTAILEQAADVEVLASVGDGEALFAAAVDHELDGTRTTPLQGTLPPGQAGGVRESAALLRDVVA